MYQNMRPSSKRTTVAVLRKVLELPIEEFAGLIGKSVETIRSLESGRLKLGEETARKISEETGVSIDWLLATDPSKKPFTEDDFGVRWPYDREIFESIQAEQHKSSIQASEIAFEVLHAATVRHCLDWLPIFASAQLAGKGDVAVYLLRRFFGEMKERFGSDYDIARQAAADSNLTTSDGEKYAFLYRALNEPPDALLLSIPKRASRKARSSPLQPSPENAHPEGGHRSS
jgi:transcriptional regulator with XRE-family HTH domain